MLMLNNMVEWRKMNCKHWKCVSKKRALCPFRNHRVTTAMWDCGLDLIRWCFEFPMFWSVLSRNNFSDTSWWLSHIKTLNSSSYVSSEHNYVLIVVKYSIKSIISQCDSWNQPIIAQKGTLYLKLHYFLSASCRHYWPGTIVESTTGYTFTPCVGYFTSPSNTSH